MNTPDATAPDTTGAAPCACHCADAAAPDAIRAEGGRLVEADAISAVWLVRHGERCEVVAHFHPVVLAECGDYAEARAVQERVQAWLDSAH